MRLFSTVIATLSLSVIVLSGCHSIPLSRIVIQRAQFDLNCSSEKLTVQPLGGATYGVVGCGQRATYIVDCNGRRPYGEHVNPGMNCTAILNSDSKRTSNRN